MTTLSLVKFQRIFIQSHVKSESLQNLTFNLCFDPHSQRSGPLHHTMTSRCLCGHF